MAVPFTELLDRRFAELGVGPTDSERADRLQVDKGTFSKIMSGKLPLTEKRAKNWSQRLFARDLDAAAEFAKKLIDAGSMTTLTVNDFCEWMVAQGGAVPAYRFIDLLKALQAADIEKVLICCEYRDLPRAGPDAKYQYLAKEVGKAIASGVCFAMFQPFGKDIPLPEAGKLNTPAFNAALYMMQIRTKCIDTYRLFWSEALASLQNMSEASKPQSLKVLKGDHPVTGIEASAQQICDALDQSWDEILIGSRLRLYVRSDGGLAHLGSGFQARMFYIRYTTTADGANHSRILQWVSTPKEDLLVYRGQNEIPPDALRDSFYPIPHFFDSVGRLPLQIDDSDKGGPGVRKYLKDTPGGEGLPEVEAAAPVGEEVAEATKAMSIWTGHD